MKNLNWYENIFNFAIIFIENFDFLSNYPVKILEKFTDPSEAVQGLKPTKRAKFLLTGENQWKPEAFETFIWNFLLTNFLRRKLCVNFEPPFLVLIESLNAEATEVAQNQHENEWKLAICVNFNGIVVPEVFQRLREGGNGLKDEAFLSLLVVKITSGVGWYDNPATPRW